MAGTGSGCGKTTVSLGLIAAFARRGLRVAPFKVGPDFIDPGHHTSVCKAFGQKSVSRNLDGWMLSEDYNIRCFRKHTKTADIAVVEGVMGLFDGYDGKSEAGSAAQMAKWLGLPVLLITGASGMARSAAALVQGFERFDPELHFAAVLFNYIGSPRHLSYLKEAVEDHVSMPCIGGMIRDAEVGIPERHLGLVTSREQALSADRAAKLADMVESHMDVDGLLAGLPEMDFPPLPEIRTGPEKKNTVRIGVAWDNAFCFYYPDNLDLLSSFGAEPVFFSPVTDSYLPENLDGLYLGGGYPELSAGSLSENARMRDDIRGMSEKGMPVYAECGGFMYLCKEISDTEGRTYPMTGIFPFRTAMFPRLRSLGYREIRLKSDTILGPCGLRMRGHEFHYSGIRDNRDNEDTAGQAENVYIVSDRAGQTDKAGGFHIRRTLGSYIHLHFGSEPAAARHFVRACREYQQERIGT
ncbi:MAG: cobyrinate a,c-diamide synthase [Desulfococcaceae bacterium]|nr:cobyrinate a,c-diamide synthase [Desulfococcaceae bacterium]